MFFFLSEFRSESLCGEARGTEQQRAILNGGSRDRDGNGSGSGSGDGSVHHHPLLPITTSASTAGIESTANNTSPTCFLVDQENDELQKALRLSLEVEDDGERRPTSTFCNSEDVEWIINDDGGGCE